MTKNGSYVMGLDKGPPPPSGQQSSPTVDAYLAIPSWTNITAFDPLENNPKLMFPTSIDTYHQMRTDPQIQGLITGSTWPLLRMKWYLDPNGAREEAVAKISADYNLPVGPEEPPPDPSAQNNVLHVSVPGTASATVQPPSEYPEFNRRRSQGRFDFLHHTEEALDAIASGFEMFEQVGYIGKDGKWHLRKLSLIPNQTITEIRLEQDGGIKEVVQGALVQDPIDIGRIVVYSFQRRGANWHGRSLLRGCYGPWLLKDRAMRVGVMNIQRAGVGTPIAQGPPGASKSDLEVLSDMMQKFVAGDRSGGAVPFGSVVKLLGVEGGQPDTVGFIKLMNEEMARSFFQMFMQLGQTTSGSRALGGTFVEYHKLVIEYIAQWYTQLFNEHVIEDDIDWNYGPEEEFCPLLCWKWDEVGSDRNPEGPQAAENPTHQLQKLAKDGEIQVDNATASLLFS